MPSQEPGNLEKWQAEDAVMAAVDPAEQMHAGTFDLVASRAPEGGIADDIEIGFDLDIIESAEMKLIAGKMVPDPGPVTKDHRGGVQAVRFAGQARQLAGGSHAVSRLAQHLAVYFKNLVSGQKKLARGGQARLCHCHAFHFGQ